MSIFIKNGISKEQLIDLLAFSRKAECQFLFQLGPAKNDDEDTYEFQQASAIRFLEVDQHVHKEVLSGGKSIRLHRFSVKICVEDNFWEAPIGESKLHHKTGVVPAEIKIKVAEILG
jgi:hypothetical protein